MARSNNQRPKIVTTPILLAILMLVVGFAAIIGEALARQGYYADEAAAPAPALDAQAVRAIARDEIAEAGLTGEALERRMERAIIAFIKSRATEPGASATPDKTQPAPTAAIDVEPIDRAAEPVAGDPGARYQLIVYSDYECPYCKRFAPTLEAVIAQYGDQLAVTLRDYPLPFHGEVALREAVAAHCAFTLGGDAAFWSYSHGIFKRTASNGQGLPDGGLLDLAVEVGLDRAAFEDCLASPGDIRAGIEADRASGNAAGVRGTPTSVLLDTRSGQTALLRGAQPLSAVTSVLEELLGEPSAVVSKPE